VTDQLIDHTPVKVHLSSSDLPLAPTQKRCRRGVSFRTVTLTTSDPVQQILPQNLNRVEAWAQAFTNAVTVYSSRADAQAAGGAGITLPVANTAPYPLNTTDAVWATASVLPTTISVTAIIEDDYP
jgi:hypothetical protein